ncbi:MAG: SDR family NAD(P)-dependent oxidoreductase [Nocardioidaceae bacterium]
MSEHTMSPVAIVGTAAIMPQAPDAATFWANITGGRYCVTDVPPERWDPALFFSEDHALPDHTYSRIGGWVREFPWDPVSWKLPIPPKVAQQMDQGQRWAISAARSALTEAGWPNWNVDTDRVAVILGNAIGGEKHYQTSMRIKLPEVLKKLAGVPSLVGLPADVQRAIVEETREAYLADQIDITEDTMPGELSNVIAGRVANLFNLRGPNFTTDAACASGLAALNAAVHGLIAHDYDAVVTGGIDRNMGVDAFVKFCKIGALSATGTRPFDAGADGFVMGEGAALFVLKRLEDAEAAGDRIHAVILGIGGSSDGKGKGITAPNPVGQKLAVERAWAAAGEDPSTATAVEAHGTSTRVGDAAELNSLTGVFGAAGAKPGTIALGSVKSNIGHLKAAAGTAGLFKMVYSLREKQLVPSLNFVTPNENVDWDTVPFKVNTQLRAWPEPAGGVRRAGVSAFGFGGTNFHVVVEEHVPGRHKAAPQVFASAEVPARTTVSAPVAAPVAAKPPLRGALVLGAADDASLLTAVRAALADAQQGKAPAPAVPSPETLAAPVRAAVDFADAADLAGKLDKLEKALTSGNPAVFRMARQQGAFVGRGPAPKVAFLYTGQGSQYVNMLKGLSAREAIVGNTFAEADQVMTPLLGRSLSSYIFIDGDDPTAVKAATQQLLQTEITQPAVLATDLAMTRLLSAYGMTPDMVMGHSLGEYGALVASGALTFESALEAVSARGREMASLSIDDNGAMAAVFGPLPEIERIVAEADGYVVIANVNSNSQAVVGGATAAVEKVVETFNAAGINAVRIPVSHAFHTSIVAPASVPLVAQLRRLDVRGPQIPCVANVTGDFYPTNAGTDVMLDYLGKQVASPVQFVKGLHTLYDAGARVFVEVGPKKALHGFVEDVLGGQDDVLALYTNHPKLADEAAFNQALCGLYAAGLGGVPVAPVAPVTAPATTTPEPTMASDDTIHELGKLFAGVLEQGLRIYGAPATTVAPAAPPAPAPAPVVEVVTESRPPLEPVVITGAGLGLPGRPQVFGDDHVASILAGQQFIGQLPESVLDRMVDMRITRLVKSESKGASFATIDDPAEVIKLAGLHAPLDVVEQFGVDAARDEALDNATRLAIGSGFEALRDAGIPLVQRYKKTTLGTQLPDRWGLPEELRDDTGVVFASAFPGFERLVEAVEDYAFDRGRRDQILALEGLLAQLPDDAPARAEVEKVLAEARADHEAHPYEFDRRFLFRVLSMGHSQFADLIGARGPNTQVNAACASTTQALSVAEDWIRSGRCRRVVVVSADDATGDRLMPWIGAGFLASGAAATDANVEDAATPFDRRRHGMIIGMGAAALVVESAEAARERGIQPICEVLGAVTANSAFHGTRLDVEHIAGVMEAVMSEAERHGIDRRAIAPQTVFVSHETYTPARGGSASAEVHALRSTFGDMADQVVITNTKGFTGHAMGTGIEDVLAIKALETGLVPAVPNYKEPDPDLGSLNLSTGGSYPVEYALRLAAGFGSQIAMSILRRVPMPDGRRRAPEELGYSYRIVDQAAWQRWLDRLSGHTGATVEVDHRRLRVVDTGAPEVPVVARTHVPVPYADAPVAQVTAAPASVAPAAPAPVAPAPVAPAPVAPAAAAAPAPVPAAPAVDPVLAEVTKVVSEMTGYPPELLDPELDLEADLGVDTVKQAEVFAAVRGEYGVERDETLQLRDFPTLNHVAAWVRSKTGIPAPVAAPAAAPVASAPAAPAPVAVAAPAADEVLAAVTTVVAEMTGYPPELLDPELDLEADLGVDTVKQAEVFAAVRGHYNVERDETLQLRDFPTLNHVAAWVRSKTGIPAPVAAPAAAPAVAAPAPAEAAPVAAAPAADEVLATVTKVVAEMTGYPEELLDPELDLEADLGVDTVKQAEVFAAVRGHYNVERDESLQLRDFPTLNHVAAWVRSKTGIPAPVAAPAAAPAAAAEAAPVAAPVAADEVLATVTKVVAEMTGYPEELLDPELDLEADLGVDTVKQAEVFAAVRGQYGVERDESLQLRDFPTLNHVAAWVRSKTGIAAPAVPAAPAEVAPAAAAPAADEVLATVTKVVAEMTGYPEELLDPELDLEADLGVDTVKQAEVFAAVRGHYNVERDESLQLRDFPTLNHVAAWVRSKAGIAAPSAVTETSAPTVETPAVAAPAPSLVTGDLAAIDALPRRIPVPSLRPAADACTPTGVRLEEARVVVMLDEGGVGAALVKKLEKAGATALTLEPGVATEDLSATLDAWLADGPVDGVYWLPALDEDGDLDGDGWSEQLRRRVKTLYTTMRRLWDDSPFLVSATRLGGFHGYDAAGATSPLGGAVTGFTKSYKKERPDALVKAVDLPASRKTAAVADLLVDETLRDPGCVEVGVVDGRRWGVAFREVPFTALAEDGSPLGDGGTQLTHESVVVVTGAAGSIVSAITADLAAASGATFHLLDLTATPDPADPDLAAFRSDKDGLKATIMARIQAAGGRPTPVAIEKELAGIERREAALSAVEAVQSAGGTPVYHCVDLTDAEAVTAALAEVGDRVDLLLHAAGLEISRNLPDKEPREFDLVFDVKANGWRNVWSALAEREVGAVVVFSSVAGRFGNNGQTDYAAANDLLCKTVSSLRRTRPQTRGLALDWTAWGGIGMATRGSIPKIMEMAGVQMLPPEAGVAWIRRELASGPYSGEVVVAGRLGMMAAEYDPSGGLEETDGYDGAMVGEVALSVHDGLVATVTLDPAEQPFLNDHRIDGTPVLPGVMGMEAFAEVARILAPEGYVVRAVEDVHFEAPVKFYRDEPRTLRIAMTVEPDGADLLGHATLTAERVLPGQSAPVRTVHFTGTVRLATERAEAETVKVNVKPGKKRLSTEQVYSFYFHGPAYQVVDTAWKSGKAALARLTADLPDDRVPTDTTLANAPRLVELCFQTAGLWQAGRDGQLALPMAVDRVSVLEPEPQGRLFAVSREVGEATYDVMVVTGDGQVVVRLDGYHSIPVPMPIPEEVAGPLTETYAD